MELETVADLKLAARAFNEGWAVPVETCKEVVERARVRAICGDPDIEDKAGKLLLAIAKFNQQVAEAEQKKLDAEHTRKLQLIELAVKLGIAGNDGQRTGVVDSQPAGISNT